MLPKHEICHYRSALIWYVSIRMMVLHLKTGTCISLFIIIEVESDVNCTASVSESQTNQFIVGATFFSTSTHSVIPFFRLSLLL